MWEGEGHGAAGGSGLALAGGGSTATAGAVVVVMGVPVAVIGIGIIMQMAGQENAQKNADKAQEATKGESETGNWNKGSFDSPEDSLDYHYGRHGDEVGATSRDQYLRKAEEFARTAKKGSTKSRVDGAVEGRI